MDYRKELVVKPGAQVRLDRIDPSFPEVPHDNREIDERVEKNRARMADQQLRIYAERRHSVLIVLQGLDAAGKDSVVKHILSTMNPMSCTVTAFKVPTPTKTRMTSSGAITRARPPRAGSRSSTGATTNRCWSSASTSSSRRRSGRSDIR